MQQYVRTVSDPFEYGPVPLGYGTFLPTTMATAFLRGSISVNADGSFALVFFPDAQAIVQPCATPYTSPHSAVAFLPTANAASILSNFREGRVVSGGMRAIALFPETSAPGIMGSGITADQNLSDFNTHTTKSLFDLPATKLGFGSRGASVTTRPYDLGGYEMFANPVSGYASTVLPYHSAGYIVGQGFPAATVIWYECILNIEGLARSSVNSVGTPADMMDRSSFLSSIYSAPERLYSAAMNLVSPAVIMDASLGAATGFVAGGAPGAASGLLRSVARSFGGGTHITRHLNSVQQQRGRENTHVIVEEEKADGTYELLHRVRR